MTVTELPAEYRNPMRRSMNRALMVRFISADLIARAHLDVSTSAAFYDASGTFVYATHALPDADTLARLHAATRIHFYTMGL